MDRPTAGVAGSVDKPRSWLTYGGAAASIAMLVASLAYLRRSEGPRDAPASRPEALPHSEESRSRTLETTR
jgi:hypothetical protein